MSFRTRILRQAVVEVRDIHDWIAERSSAGAAQWMAAFQAAAAQVVLDPESFPTAPESEFVDYHLREFHFKTRHGRKFRALFTVVENEVRILHVRGAGQDIVKDPGPLDDSDTSAGEGLT